MTYQLSLEGKTALITAAGQGIGRASLGGVLTKQTKLQRLQLAWPRMPADSPRAKPLSSMAAGPSERKLS